MLFQYFTQVTVFRFTLSENVTGFVRIPYMFQNHVRPHKKRHHERTNLTRPQPHTDPFCSINYLRSLAGTLQDNNDDDGSTSHRPLSLALSSVRPLGALMSIQRRQTTVCSVVSE